MIMHACMLSCIHTLCYTNGMQMQYQLKTRALQERDSCTAGEGLVHCRRETRALQERDSCTAGEGLVHCSRGTLHIQLFTPEIEYTYYNYPGLVGS